MTLSHDPQELPDSLSQETGDDQWSGSGEDQAVVLAITDELDLHLFRPKEIGDLVDDYFDECLKRGLFSVRLIHGKGTGALRGKVHSLLKKDKRVASFCLAPPEAGGWGATRVELKAGAPTPSGVVFNRKKASMAATQTRDAIQVTAAILFSGGSVLIARRPPGDALAGKWEFPGGKVEAGETPEQCLAREMEEEFGIRVEVGAFWGESVYAYPQKKIRLLAYQVAWTGGTMVSRSHSAWCFVAPERLDDVELAPADRPIAWLIVQRMRDRPAPGQIELAG